MAQSRAIAPVVGIVVLVLVTVVIALSVSLALTTPDLDERPTATLSLAVDGETDRVALTHEGGDRLDVSELNLTIEINGTRLDEQPPVPFFAADGFEGGPTGPFNTNSTDDWRAGETAGVRIAETNDPLPSSGSTVTVLVSVEGGVIAEVETTVR